MGVRGRGGSERGKREKRREGSEGVVFMWVDDDVFVVIGR